MHAGQMTRCPFLGSKGGGPRLLRHAFAQGAAALTGVNGRSSFCLGGHRV
jgi:hypothetical protein